MRTSPDIREWSNADLIKHANDVHLHNIEVAATADRLARNIAHQKDEDTIRADREHLLLLFSLFGW